MFDLKGVYREACPRDKRHERQRRIVSLKQTSEQANIHQLIWQIPDVDLLLDQTLNPAMKRTVFADNFIFYWFKCTEIQSSNNRVKQAILCLLSFKFLLELNWILQFYLCWRPPPRSPQMASSPKKCPFSSYSVLCETDESIWHQDLFGNCVRTWGEYSTSMGLWVVKWTLQAILGLGRRIDEIG